MTTHTNLVDPATGEVVEFDKAAAERRAERINDAARSLRASITVARAGGITDDQIADRLGLSDSRSGADHLYFIQSQSGPVKIGRARNVAQRLNELQTGSPDALAVLGVLPARGCDESAWHHRYRHFRIRGEWFEPIPELLDSVAHEVALAEVPA